MSNVESYYIILYYIVLYCRKDPRVEDESVPLDVYEYTSYEEMKAHFEYYWENEWHTKK